MLELAHAYATSHLKGKPWGFHFSNGWAGYLKTIADLGQTKKQLAAGDVYTNDLLLTANKKADDAKARADAKKFKLNSAFAATKVDPNFKM
jgi:hypothetical protein